MLREKIESEPPKFKTIKNRDNAEKIQNENMERQLYHYRLPRTTLLEILPESKMRPPLFPYVNSLSSAPSPSLHRRLLLRNARTAASSIATIVRSHQWAAARLSGGAPADLSGCASGGVASRSSNEQNANVCSVQ
jgi:hypothetical protein